MLEVVISGILNFPVKMLQNREHFYIILSRIFREKGFSIRKFESQFLIYFSFKNSRGEIFSIYEGNKRKTYYCNLRFVWSERGNDRVKYHLSPSSTCANILIKRALCLHLAWKSHRYTPEWAQCTCRHICHIWNTYF